MPKTRGFTLTHTENNSTVSRVVSSLSNQKNNKKKKKKKNKILRSCVYCHEKLNLIA